MTETHASTPMAREIDAYCDSLTDRVGKILGDFSGLTDDQIERIVLEAHQVSVYNPPILTAAVKSSEVFAEKGIKAELVENLEEEQGHAALYEKGLGNIGTDVSARTPWPASDALFKRVFDLMDDGPSSMLGAMYASEAIALFESETLRELARELTVRRGFKPEVEGRRVIAFHDMHLGGVEQAHKDGLGQYLHTNPVDGEGEAVDLAAAWNGAKGALDAIYTWWVHLLPGLEPLEN